MAIPLALMLGAVTAGINAASQRRREKNSMKNQMALMKEQMYNQQQLNQQGADLQFQQWQKTNYPAQMEMMKKAGLNPGLMYGLGGAGGGTVGSQGGGSAQGGQAPQPQQLDIQGAMQVALMEAQKKNIEADTRNKEAEAGYTGGAKTENTKADTGNKEQTYKLDKEYEGQRRASENTKLDAESRVKNEEAYRLDRTNQDYIEQEKLRTAGMIIDNIAKQEGINLSRKQQYQIEEQITQNWEKISLYDTEVNIKIAEAIIKGIGTVGGLINARQIAEMLAKAKGALKK